MIERYSYPEMRAVWTSQNKFAKWLEADDPLLVAAGREAVDQYNELAEEAAIEDEREHQGFDS